MGNTAAAEIRSGDGVGRQGPAPSGLRLGLGEVVGATTFLPLTASLHKLHAFTTLEDAALGSDGTAFGLETAMLGHGVTFRGLEIGAQRVADSEQSARSFSQCEVQVVEFVAEGMETQKHGGGAPFRNLNLLRVSVTLCFRVETQQLAGTQHG
jgi:hypothetical protein